MHRCNVNFILQPSFGMIEPFSFSFFVHRKSNPPQPIQQGLCCPLPLHGQHHVVRQWQEERRPRVRKVRHLLHTLPVNQLVLLCACFGSGTEERGMER